MVEYQKNLKILVDFMNYINYEKTKYIIDETYDDFINEFNIEKS